MSPEGGAASADRRVELIEQGFEAWERGDVETVLGICDPQIEVFAPPEIGNPGTYHGTDGFLEWTGDWLEAWESFQQNLISVELVGSHHALARVEQTGLGKGSGIRLEQEATYVCEVRNEQLMYMSLFFNHEGAAALAREREATAPE